MACSHEVAGILQRSTSPSLFSPGAREACDEAASTAGTSSGGKKSPSNEEQQEFRGKANFTSRSYLHLVG